MEVNQQVESSRLLTRYGQCWHRQKTEPENSFVTSSSSSSSSSSRSSQEGQQASSRKTRTSASIAGKSQLSSLILFASVIILINLCSFHLDLPAEYNEHVAEIVTTTTGRQRSMAAKHYLNYFESCVGFVKIMFTQPMRFNGRTTRYTLAEARMLGKMAKVWYIKKKIKKLSKKLKKHTIAVPVFTTIPIYEHSYYPQPHVTHVSHGGGGHHAAASSYAPSMAQLASAALPASPIAAPSSTSQQQMATSASNQHRVAYGMSPQPGAARGASAMYHYPMAAGSHRIINAYAPSPPLYVDDNGGLYGHYGNAYGRYDGGYHVW